MRRLWIAFAPYIAASTVHIAALAAGAETVAAPTKLALMPLLALPVAWSAWGRPWTTAHTLLVPVAVYGLVLGATAAGAARCHPLVAWGGAFFLASDTVLAFRLFLPDAMPDWTSPIVMLTYCAGQGLIALGVLVAVRARRPAEVPA